MNTFNCISVPFFPMSIYLVVIRENTMVLLIKCFTQLESGKRGNVEGSQFLITVALIVLLCELGLHRIEIWTLYIVFDSCFSNTHWCELVIWLMWIWWSVIPLLFWIGISSDPVSPSWNQSNKNGLLVRRWCDRKFDWKGNISSTIVSLMLFDFGEKVNYVTHSWSHSWASGSFQTTLVEVFLEY